MIVPPQTPPGSLVMIRISSGSWGAGRYDYVLDLEKRKALCVVLYQDRAVVVEFFFS
jgi:hypothetical protein